MKTVSPPTPARTYAGYTYTCVTCELQIEGKPTFHLGVAFCCAGCAVSGPCTCSYDDRLSAAELKAAAEACECRADTSVGLQTPELADAPEPASEQRNVTREPQVALSRR